MSQPAAPVRGDRLRRLRRNIPFLVMMLPGILFLAINNYLPMAGAIMAFQRYRFNGNFIRSIFTSQWMGLRNFEFVFKNPDVWNYTRNTILYNLVFIVIGMVVPITLAIAMSQMWSRKSAKVYQTFMFLPYFLSWVVVSYLGFAFLSFNNGAINRMILEPLGIKKVNWYRYKNAWPTILIIVNMWKNVGYNSVVYLAALSGISDEYYEAADIDGVTKLQQIWYITLPMIRPIAVILGLLALGRIFNSDFGLFFNMPMSSSAVFSVTEVLDTMIYRSLRGSIEIGMSAASSLYQSVVGCVTIVAANALVRRLEADSALF